MAYFFFFPIAVQWWEEWQLRVLVLASLFIQFFLFCAARLRKYSIPAWFRFIIWLAYLGSDAVAVYALAVLFNRQQQQEWIATHRSSYSLQVLWAPILLIHLGGQDSITAYNIEDNELWKRHVLTAISQVTVAVYVFLKSWSGDGFILQAAILLFIFGTVKCLFKPWDLKRVSINSLVGSSGAKQNDEMSSFDQYIRAVTQHFQGMHSLLRTIVQQVQPEACNGSLHRGPLNSEEAIEAGSVEVFEPEIFKAYKLFVDLAPPYSSRFNYLKYMLCNPDKVHLLVQCGLSVTFDRLYTKKTLELPGSSTSPTCFDMQRRSTRFPWFLTLDGFTFLVRLFAMTGTLFSCLLLFQRSNKKAYNQTDVKITFALLYPPAILDVVLPFTLPCIRAIKRVDGSRPWPDHVAQYNLIGYLAHNRKQHWIILQKLLPSSTMDFIDQQLWSMKPFTSSRDITELVSNHIKAGWWQIHDVASYRRFNDSRGQWTLGQEGLLDALGWSLSRPFDESLLLWHLATDFFYFQQYHHTGTGRAPAAQQRQQRRQLQQQRQRQLQAACISRAMSNYMAYLLFVNPEPEMLIPGARRSLFKDAYKELEGIIASNDDDQPLLLGGQQLELTGSIIRRLREAAGRNDDSSGSGVVHDAWAIAQVLAGLHGDEAGEDVDKVWRVVQGVWVEMLCFSAGRCRGYLHAKSMATGGQYLSYVWLLLFYMGMETLAEKMQRTDLHQETRHEVGTGTAAVPRSPAPPASPGGSGSGRGYAASSAQAQAADPTSASPTRATNPRSYPPTSALMVQSSTSPASAARAGDNNDVVLPID